jgi:hypothetical protein
MKTIYQQDLFQYKLDGPTVMKERSRISEKVDLHENIEMSDMHDVASPQSS